MGQVHVQVVLTNHRETVMAHLGHLPISEVHRIEVEALVDTGAIAPCCHQRLRMS